MTKEYRITTRVYDLKPGDVVLINDEPKIVSEIQSIAAWSWIVFFTDGSQTMRKGSTTLQLLEIA